MPLFSQIGKSRMQLNRDIKKAKTFQQNVKGFVDKIWAAD